MSILTKDELKKLNLTMLGLGEPIQIDGQGYNKFDYSKMYFLSGCTELTDYDAYTIADALVKYSHTQLSSYAEDIKDTKAHYSSLVKTITIKEFSKNTIKLSWDYDKSVSEFIKTSMDKSWFKWSKPETTWYFTVQWAHIDGLLTVFQNSGFSTIEIQSIQKNLDELLKSKETYGNEEPKEPIKLIVTRPESTIDTIVLRLPYSHGAVQVFKSIPHMFFNNSNKTWECYIEYSHQLYKALEELNANSDEKIDLSELHSWSELVKNWDSSYDLIDTSKCPLKFQPYDFQIEDAKTLFSKRVMLNANDMGCGKTFEQVIIGESLSSMKKLVICPPTLRINWRKEILHVNPNAKVHIIYSSENLQVTEGWNIIGYNSLDKFQKQLEAENFQVIMIDEAHYIQAINNSGNPDSKRAYGVLRLAATAGWVYPITGTPKTNRNKNLFNILRVIRHPLTRGKYAFAKFGREYCDGQQNRFGWDFNGNSHDEELNSQINSYMIRHLKSEVLPHLKKQRIITPVEVDLKGYQYEIEQYLKYRENKNAEALARLMRARKVLATQKVNDSIDFANNLILEDKKVVIVTCFTEVVAAVEKAFKGNVVKLVGGMSDTAKDAAIVEFQTGKPQIMVMNIVAGGVGITLTRSYNMIINDFDWTPGNLTQAEDRICRGGQTEEYCNIYYLYASGADMDEVFADTLTSKFSTINTVVDGGSGDSIDYLKLITDALENSNDSHVAKSSKPLKTEISQQTKETKPVQTTDFKDKSLEDLISLADSLNVSYKTYDNPSIFRMRLVMAIKKQLA